MKSDRVSITGAWKREGQGGVFFTGNCSKQELLDKLSSLGDHVQLFVSPIENKSNENSPDLNISIATRVPKGA